MNPIMMDPLTITSYTSQLVMDPLTITSTLVPLTFTNGLLAAMLVITATVCFGAIVALLADVFGQHLNGKREADAILAYGEARILIQAKRSVRVNSTVGEAYFPQSVPTVRRNMVPVVRV